MSDFPPGWALATLPDLIGPHGLFADGDWIESKDQDPAGDVRLVQLADIGDGEYRDRSSRFLTSKRATELGCTFLAKGDVLVSRLADPLGRACIFPGDKRRAVTAVDVCIVRPGPVGVDPEWLMRTINAPQFRRAIEAHSSGTTRKRISRNNLGTVNLPVPPLNEQRRIVDRIVALTARGCTAREALEKVPPLLERFRQSTLAAAFRGGLTAEWRRRHPNVEPASVLLERIRAERRQRWEEAELATMRAKGKKPANAWKSKYREPIQVEGVLQELPAGWCWASVDDLLYGIETGSNFKCLERPPEQGEVGVAKVSAVTWGDYDEQASKTCTDLSRVDERLFVRSGDFLFSRANTLDLVGACVLAWNVNRCIMLSDKILRFLVVPALDPLWLLHGLRSPLGRRQIETLASGNQLSMRNIGQERIRSIRLPLPPVAEMSEIIRRLETSLNAARALADRALAAKHRVDQLEQSILARAFRGELVPQDPHDEPATTLLERIRAEREAVHGTSNGTRRRRNPAKLTGSGSAPPPDDPPTPPRAPESAQSSPKKARARSKVLETVLSCLKREALHRIADAAGADLADRRSLAAAREGLVRADVGLETVVAHLDRDELKAVCRVLNLEDRGKTKAELRDRILGAHGPVGA